MRANPRLRTLLAVAVLAPSLGCRDRPPPHLRRPNHIVFDGQGRLLVADPLAGRVVRFHRDGRFDRVVGRHGLGREEFWGVQGLARLPGGGFAALDYRLRSLEDQTDYFAELKVFGPDDRVRRTFEVPRPDLQGEGYHEGIAALPDGFAVPDSAGNALIVVDTQGRHVRTLTEIAGGPPLSAPMRPRFVDGQIWLVEYRAHRVRRITPDGRETFRLERRGDGPDEVRFPWAVDVSPEGWFVVADLGNYRLQRFDAEGRHLATLTPEPSAPGVPLQLTDVRIGPDGLLYAVDSKGGRIVVLTADGRPVRTLSFWG